MDPDELDRWFAGRPDELTPWFRLEWARIRDEHWDEVTGLINSDPMGSDLERAR